MIGALILGLFAGLIARALVPGKQDIGFLLTIVLGLVGAAMLCREPCVHLLDAGRPSRAHLLADGQVQAHVQEGIDAALFDRELAARGRR